MAGKSTNVPKSVKDRVVSFFSPHKRRISQIETYMDKSVEISDDFRNYARTLPEKIRKKCSNTVRRDRFDLYGFNSDWNEIDEHTRLEKINLYREFFNASSEHDKNEIAAMTRLNEIQYELAAAQTQLDALYDKLLFQNTVYRRGHEDTSGAADDTADDTEDAAPDTPDGVPA